ncbi:hypothetical protein RB623_10010 [Mesorhizobium sp. LHD-90]|uniref:hypothetical protein n=1 Tax=Mesorhizobium sp. LHD-90 TaxID=3071414 RepID=UPI0027DEEAE4|nr:hypothetical protein [Mesorhizobium sp. LHD-90]MDQ6434382.1 hypothetical protein [Mesorhizobium sp. LHD-90]
MRDLFHSVGAVLALTPAVKTAAGDGAAIDLKGYGSVVFVVSTGAIVGAGDFGIKVQHSDASGSGYEDAPAGTFFSNAPATLGASTAYKLGYIGDKRYARIVLTYASGTSIAAGAVAILGRPASAPVA